MKIMQQEKTTKEEVGKTTEDQKVQGFQIRNTLGHYFIMLMARKAAVVVSPKGFGLWSSKE